MRNIQLVVIDPQNSFCKTVEQSLQQSEHDGELCVPGAWEDMERLSTLVNTMGAKLNKIHVTLDSHHQSHIAHPGWFKNINNGSSPTPFTIMEPLNDTIIGSDGEEYTTKIPQFFKRTLEYLKALKSSNRYPHCIWPPHCLIGSPGHNVVKPLLDAVFNWENIATRAVNWVTKGSNFFVEHFSAVRAEVPDPNDPSTQLNMDFINIVMEADEILLSGEASSHCVANTFRDMANEFSDNSFIKKCILLKDATSSVPGFETYEKDFIDEMTQRGMKLSTCQEYLL